MKIIVITNLFPPDGWGGAERVIEDEVDALIKDGHSVVVITTSIRPKLEHFQNLKIIRIRPWNIYPFGKGGDYGILSRFIWNVIDTFHISTFFRIKKILKRERPDRVICHNLKGLGLFVPDAIRSQNIRYIMHLHDVQYVSPSGIIKSGKERKFFYSLYAVFARSFLRSPDEVISYSQWLLSFYEKYGFFKHSKKTIEGFDWAHFDIINIEKKLKVFQEKVKHNKEIHFLYVGKIEEHKGILWFLSLWKKSPSNFFLTILGGGGREEELKNTIKGSKTIIYKGELNREELVKEYKNADVLIMPTLCYENRPRVIIEAYENNLPVIASNLGGIPEIVRDGVTGIIFKAGDKHSLVEILT